MDNFSINDFPPHDLGRNINILIKIEEASSKLAYLDAIKSSLPSPELMLWTLPLQEAQDSSEIENIITTSDELYQARAGATKAPAAIKEVEGYVHGVNLGIRNLKDEQNLITVRNILAIQEAVVGNDAGFRQQAGTVIKNESTGEILHTPPQDPEEIKGLMAQLLEYINLDNGEHPLIKMALIHHQFERIHPFYDGNGRTGRILNILYLIKEKRLSLPVLYISRFINHNKSEYYRLLKQVRDDGCWEEWVIYMLTGVANTAAQANDLIEKIKQQFSNHKEEIRSQYKFYSHELLNHIYAYPYTSVRVCSANLNIGRHTSTKYLQELSKGGILDQNKINNRMYYINHKLISILSAAPSLTLSK